MRAARAILIGLQVVCLGCGGGVEGNRDGAGIWDACVDEPGCSYPGYAGCLAYRNDDWDFADCASVILACHALGCDGKPALPGGDCVDAAATLAAAMRYCWIRCTPEASTTPPDLGVVSDPQPASKTYVCSEHEPPGPVVCADGTDIWDTEIVGRFSCSICDQLADRALAAPAMCK